MAKHIYFFDQNNEETDTDYNPKLKTHSTWIAPIENPILKSELLGLTLEIKQLLLRNPKQKDLHCPLTRYFKSLKKRGDIRILQSDKNLGLTAVSTLQYHLWITSHLDQQQFYISLSRADYEEELRKAKVRYKTLHEHLSQRALLTDQDKKYLSFPKTEMAVFHILPKLHKKWTRIQDIKTRPIVGAHSTITTTWSTWLSTQLEKVELQFVLKNSLQLIKEIEFTKFNTNCFLITMDVSSLYTNMDLSLLYNSVFETTEEIMLAHVTEFICSNNFFTYADKIFKQINGIAMGTNAAVHLANIFLDFYLDQYAHAQKGVHFYRRYIDDIFIIFEGDPQPFYNYVNNLIPGITMTMETSKTKIPFLDLYIHLEDSTITFSTFQKPLNSYQYLLPTSYHPKHVFSGYIKGELIRFLKNSSKQEHFINLKQLFRLRLLARGYKPNFLDQHFAKITYSLRSRYLHPDTPETKQPIIPFILPYTPRTIYPGIQTLLREMNAVFPSLRILLVYKTTPNLFSLSTQSRLTPQHMEYLNEIYQRTNPALTTSQII